MRHDHRPRSTASLEHPDAISAYTHLQAHATDRPEGLPRLALWLDATRQVAAQVIADPTGPLTALWALTTTQQASDDLAAYGVLDPLAPVPTLPLPALLPLLTACLDTVIDTCADPNIPDDFTVWCLDLLHAASSARDVLPTTTP